MTKGKTVHCIYFFTFCVQIWSYRVPDVEDKPNPTPYHDWDYLMFSQRWPITSCEQWEESKANNTCAFPQDKLQWTVHGIWPTKTGTDGPWFCPSAVHFDPEQLQPFIDQLNNQWTNVEANTKPNSFWKHEWDKHGTCAITLPQLNSIPNYFLKGLEWNKNYNLANILVQSKITPGSNGYTPEQIANAVKSVTKCDPIIECVVDKNTKESLISEIRICFNKSLDVIDCDAKNPIHTNNGTIITNCSLKKAVMYLSTLPSSSINYQMDYVDQFLREMEENRYFLELYKLVKFLIWFTI